MNYLGSSPRCACGRYYRDMMPTGHFCTSMSGNVPYVITGNDCDAAIPDEIREFEEACAKATRQQEAMRRENNRERRRHWREQAAREFARGPRR